MPGTLECTRESLQRVLRSYGEDEVAAVIANLPDEQWRKIGSLAFDYVCRPSSGLLAKALALAAVEVVEGTPRDLRRKRRDFRRE